MKKQPVWNSSIFLLFSTVYMMFWNWYIIMRCNSGRETDDCLIMEIVKFPKPCRSVFRVEITRQTDGQTGRQTHTYFRINGSSSYSALCEANLRNRIKWLIEIFALRANGVLSSLRWDSRLDYLCYFVEQTALFWQFYQH